MNKTNLSNLSFHPQSDAKFISGAVRSIAESGCLALSYLFCAGVPLDSMEYLKWVERGMRAGVIDSDSTVLSAGAFLNLVTGEKWAVEKKALPEKSIEAITRPTPTRFLAKGHGGHWVAVENGRIVFNPLETSYNVNYGEPVEIREMRRV